MRSRVAASIGSARPRNDWGPEVAATVPGPAIASRAAERVSAAKAFIGQNLRQQSVGFCRTASGENTYMSNRSHLQLARDAYRAYETGDRQLIEGLLADDLVFSSPPDPKLDRAEYFERCWPNAQHIAGFEFVRLVEVDDEVLATYEATRADGTRFRNTEIFGFDGDRVARVEVYFGWDL